MRSVLVGVIVAIVLLVPSVAHTQNATIQKEAPSGHPNPRVKASYRLFSIANLDKTQIWLHGAQLDIYPLSRRWVRLGIELSGGTTRDTLGDLGPARMSYGIGGASLGFQVPMRVTPFVDARGFGGVLTGQFDRPVTIGNTVVEDGSATTYIYGGGIESGVEIYLVKRMYLSLAVGWMRTTWRGIDYKAIVEAPDDGVKYRNLTGDTLTFKAGLGI